MAPIPADEPVPPLSPTELAAVRSLLAKQAHWAWLGNTIKAWLLFVTASVTGATLGVEAIRTLIHSLGGGA